MIEEFGENGEVDGTKVKETESTPVGPEEPEVVAWPDSDANEWTDTDNSSSGDEDEEEVSTSDESDNEEHTLVRTDSHAVPVDYKMLFERASLGTLTLEQAQHGAAVVAINDDQQGESVEAEKAGDFQVSLIELLDELGLESPPISTDPTDGQLSPSFARA